MGADERVTWRHHVSPADWTAPRLHPFGPKTGSVTPEGFEAYGRLFHPVESDGPDTRMRTWAEVAAADNRSDSKSSRSVWATSPFTRAIP
jgi:hypothetical protein